MIPGLTDWRTDQARKHVAMVGVDVQEERDPLEVGRGESGQLLRLYKQSNLHTGCLFWYKKTEVVLRGKY